MTKSAAPQITWHTIPWEQCRNAAHAAWKRQALRYHLPGNTWLVLEQITRLSWWHALKHPSRAAYATCSEAWLSDQIGTCRETVSDCVQVLRLHGLLQVTQRRPVKGRFMTNLYRIATSVVAHLLRLRAGAVRTARRANPIPQQGALRVTSSSHVNMPGPLGELITKWLKRGEAADQETNG